jgi:hypothetical protein
MMKYDPYSVQRALATQDKSPTNMMEV